MKRKKVLAMLLATTMMFSTNLTVFAAGSGSAAPASCSSTTTEAATETQIAVNNENGTTQNNGTSDSGKAAETAVYVQSAGAPIAIAGSNVKTSIAGAYAAKKVQGAAILDSLDNVKKSLELKGKQTPYIMIYDTDVKKSSKAMECVNAAVDALGGGKVVATLNVDLGAKENGKYTRMSNGKASMVVGLPKDADTTKTVSVICVQPGGKTTILSDKDSNPKSVTFDVQAGLGTYAIVTR